jgi:hypothetical protein
MSRLHPDVRRGHGDAREAEADQKPASKPKKPKAQERWWQQQGPVTLNDRLQRAGVHRSTGMPVGNAHRRRLTPPEPPRGGPSRGEGPPAERDAKGDLISPFIPNGVQQIEAPIRRRRSPDRSGENQRRQSGPGGHSSSHRGHSSHGGRGSAFEIQTQVFEVLKAEAKASGVELRGIALDREGFLDSDGEAVNFEKEFLEHGMLERYISSTASVLEIGARYGTSTCVISRLLSNSGSQIVVEPDETVCWLPTTFFRF